MPLLANFALAVAYEAALRLRVEHVDLASADEQMILVDAKRHVAAMTSVEALGDFDALRL